MEVVKRKKKASARQDELMTNKKMTDGKARGDADVRETHLPFVYSAKEKQFFCSLLHEMKAMGICVCVGG